MFFENQEYQQYFLLLLVGCAIIALKYFTVKKSYEKQLVSFVHPAVFLSEVNSKITSSAQALEVLAVNLDRVKTQPNRMRNIAILVAYLQEQQYSLHQIIPQINRSLSKLQDNDLSPMDKKYKNWIKQQAK